VCKNYDDDDSGKAGSPAPTNYRLTRRLARKAHAPQKPLYQAVSAPLRTHERAKAAMRFCIKAGVFIDLCMGSGHILVYAFTQLDFIPKDFSAASLYNRVH
jgi:hypothetical protein